MRVKTDWSPFLSHGIGYLAVLLWVPLCLAVIQAMGWAWPGECFSGGEFNWKDSMILFSGAGVFLVTFVIALSSTRPRLK